MKKPTSSLRLSFWGDSEMRILGNKQMRNQNQWLRVRGTQEGPAANPKWVVIWTQSPSVWPSLGFPASQGPQDRWPKVYGKLESLQTKMSPGHLPYHPPTSDTLSGAPTHCSIPGEPHPTQHWPWKGSGSTVVPTECTLPSHYPNTKTKKRKLGFTRI